MVMERRAIYVWNHVKGRLILPDNAMLSNTANRRSSRLGHGMELQLQATHLSTVQNSLLNKKKLIWNNLRPDEVSY
uniref:Uncharacterized protein n=1 Tax=Acrobeloides nanus TaxID=290746 RepID=A0A914DD69_9BILA